MFVHAPSVMDGWSISAPQMIATTHWSCVFNNTGSGEQISSLEDGMEWSTWLLRGSLPTGDVFTGTGPRAVFVATKMSYLAKIC